MSLEHPIFDLPPQLIMELAAGIHEPADIAARWGYDIMQLTALVHRSPFKQLIEQKRAELESSGATFRMKCGVMAEELAVDVFRKAADPDISLGAKLDTFKTLAKLAGLEPNPNAAVQAGPGFSVVINIPQVGTQAPQSISINSGNVIDQPKDPLASLPSFLRGAEVESLE